MRPEPACAAMRDALRLALGMTASSVTNWSLVWQLARAERLLGIAWSRGGPRIRAAAPAGVVAQWRAAALEMDARARAQLETLVELNELLGVRGVRPTVLKGPPLSMRLYGELGTRHSVDLDVLVTADARGIVRDALETNGWIRWLGEAPWDEGYYRRRTEGVEYLEVHSRLPGEALSHCGLLRIDSEPFAVAAHAVDVASGPALPVYLAGNMAKHGVLALSAVLDFHTLWLSLDVRQREETVQVARACRLRRCLRWAVAQTQLIEEAAEGDPGALRALGVRADGREFPHAYLRLIRLVDNPLDAARIAGAWVWPRPVRGSWRGLGRVWNRRFFGPSNVGSFRQTYVGS